MLLNVGSSAIHRFEKSLEIEYKKNDCIRKIDCIDSRSLHP